MKIQELWSTICCMQMAASTCPPSGHDCVLSSAGLQAWLPGRAVVEASLQNRHEVDSSGEIIQLPTYAPWKDHIYDLEEELSISPLIKFCLYEVAQLAARFLQQLCIAAYCITKGLYDVLHCIVFSAPPSTARHQDKGLLRGCSSFVGKKLRQDLV